MVKWFCYRLYVIGFVISLINLSCGEEVANLEDIPEQLFEVGTETISTRTKSGRIISEIEKKEYKRIVILATPFYTYFKALNVENNVVGIFNRERVKKVSKRIKSVGEGAHLDLEKIIQLNPDLIICNSYQLENLKSLTVPILACDEYLEAHPKGRLKFLMMIAAITKSTQEAENILKDRSSKYQNHESLNTSILKLDNFGEAWYQPGCDTYISKVIRMAGANPVCIQKSEKSEKIAHETAIFKLSENNIFLFMDWGKKKRGWKKRMKHLLELNNYPKKILYCNTTQTEYFEESVLNSHLIINDLNAVLKTGVKGRFFEIKTLEK
tara:strand:+ start:995 stop:1969 length:975 start_codon:yes stop_codon:yes gene_type:complete